jgi:hypothetical protein
MLKGEVTFWTEPVTKTVQDKVWPVETWETRRERREQFDFALNEAKQLGFVPNKKVKYIGGDKVGIIRYYNNSYVGGYNHEGEVTELHVEFEEKYLDMSHSWLVLIGD